MQNMTDELKQALDTAVKAVAAEKGYQIPEGFMVRLERPRQEGHGDLSALSPVTWPRI